MPLIPIDTMAGVAPWRALAPDGVTASTELSLSVNTSLPRPDGPASCGRITGSTKALNHVLRRPLNGLDLSAFDEIRLWLNGERTATGSAANPFCLAMRFGSATLPIGAPANTWERFLPITQPRMWEPVRFGIDDLPAAVRGAVNVVELRCVAENVAFSCNASGIAAVRDAVVSDVDAALLAMLNGALSLGGAAIPAVLHPAGGAIAQARPYFEITHFDIVFSRERSDAARPRGDFNSSGFSLEPPGNAYELFYQVTAVADDRPVQSAMLDFLLGTLTPRGQIMVNNYPLPMESVSINPPDQIGGFRTDRIPLFYRISTRMNGGKRERAVPAKMVQIDVDLVPAQ